MKNIKIGLETHIRLNTENKLFCKCKNQTTNVKEMLNRFICPICLGKQGGIPSYCSIKPVLEKALKFCNYFKFEICSYLRFDRKHYTYHDLLKSYQITQVRSPIGINSSIRLSNQTIRIEKVCIEEDAGKTVGNVKKWWNKNCIDFNRISTPLLEVVTKPDFFSIESVIEYLNQLKTTCVNLGIINPESSDSIRCDVNVSMFNKSKIELKNLNSLTEIYDATTYEIERQNKIGGSKQQETRFWDAVNRITYKDRDKADVEYLFVPEWDLPDTPLEEFDIKLFDYDTNTDFWMYFNIIKTIVKSSNTQFFEELKTLSCSINNSVLKEIVEIKNESYLITTIKICCIFSNVFKTIIDDNNFEFITQIVNNIVQHKMYTEDVKIMLEKQFNNGITNLQIDTTFLIKCITQQQFEKLKNDLNLITPLENVNNCMKNIKKWVETYLPGEKIDMNDIKKRLQF